MSVSLEKKEKNMAVLTVEIEAAELVKALQEAYMKEKGRIQIPGFRKGKAPRKMIEKLYGKKVFYEEAANILLQKTYDGAVAECGETVVSRPRIDISQIEEGKNFIYTAEVALKPEVSLGQYKGVEVPKREISVSEDEVNAEIERERDRNSRMIDVDDRPVQDGDRVKLDFDGSVDGVPFDGGKGENYDLTIGSGSFIPGFEEQIVGKNIGEAFDVNVTFPENYQSKDLQGKAAVFKCRVNSIQVKELPELNDDFAQDVSEFDTLDEYRASVEAKIRERKEKDAQNQKETAAVEKAVANAAVEIPDAMVEDQAQRMVDEFAQQLQSQGLTIDQYRQYTGMNESAFLDQMKPQAIARIRSSLVLEAIAKAEQIEISDERLDEEIQKMADQYRMEKEKFYELLSDESKAQMKEDIAVQEAVKLIGGSAVEVDMPEEETEPADLEETPDAE